MDRRPNPGDGLKCLVDSRGVFHFALGVRNRLITPSTAWPSGLRRWLQAPVRKGAGSNPAAVTFDRVELLGFIKIQKLKT